MTVYDVACLAQNTTCNCAVSSCRDFEDEDLRKCRALWDVWIMQIDQAYVLGLMIDAMSDELKAREV